MKPFSVLCSFLLPLVALSPHAIQAETPPVEESKESLLSKDVNGFAFSLYGQLNTDPSQNALFSPYSLFSCLSLVYLGARAETAAQIAKALHLSIGVAELPLAAARLTHALAPKRQDLSYELNMANALWLDRDSFVLSDYRHLAQNTYDAKVESVNFAETEKTVSIINEWTSNQTQGKIPRLLTMDDISALSRLVVTNALYFKGSWSKPFDPKMTQPAPFSTSGDDSVSLAMMEQTNSFPYYENDQIQLLALPFVGSNIQKAQMACVFFLPKTGQTLASLESTLADFTLREWIVGLDTRKVHVKIPLFSLKPRADLSTILEQMGMEIPFTKKANFAGIDGMTDLFLSKVVHEAFFSIDEKGVTAAAATAAVMNRTAVPHTEQPVEFIASRPFLFAIIDLQTKTILFLGKFTKPNMEKAA